jgi:Concanavalin A-like lectin/glucanases superfamily
MARGIALALTAALLFAGSAAARQPVAEWRFDEGAGSLAGDAGPFGLAGTLAGPSWIPGVEGMALRFDGGDSVALPDHPALEPPRITVSAWVRRAGTPGTYRYVLSKGASSCERSSYGLYTGAHGGAAFYVAGDGLYTVSPEAAPTAVWDGRWHRVTGSYDGARVGLFLDGVQVGAGTPGPTHVEYGLASRAPYVGTYRGGCELPFDGDIDRVTLWDASVAVPKVPPAPNQPPGTAQPPTAAPGHTATPPGCTSVTVSRRSVRAGRRTRLVVTVRKGTDRVGRARVVVRARKLRRTAHTNADGRARFVVRASRRQPRLVVKVLTRVSERCGTPVAHIRVRR